MLQTATLAARVRSWSGRSPFRCVRRHRSLSQQFGDELDCCSGGVGLLQTGLAQPIHVVRRGDAFRTLLLCWRDLQTSRRPVKADLSDQRDRSGVDQYYIFGPCLKRYCAVILVKNFVTPAAHDWSFPSLTGVAAFSTNPVFRESRFERRGESPSRSAAPPFPRILPPHAARTVEMCAFSIAASVSLPPAPGGREDR